MHRLYDSGGTDGSVLLKGGVGALQLATIGPLEKKLLAVQGAGSTVATTGSAVVVEGFSGAEPVIIHEARGIVTAAEFARLRAAHAAGQSATARISGRLIQYEPGLPASDMTMFGENGFLIGSEAFASQAELGKTVLHEVISPRHEYFRWRCVRESGNE